MRAFEILGDHVLDGIQVTGQFLAVMLGGGTTRPTFVRLGRQDAPGLVSIRLSPCPRRGEEETGSYYDKGSFPQRRCEECGALYTPWVCRRKRGSSRGWARVHPENGVAEIPVVTTAGVMPLYGKNGELNGHHILVRPDPMIQDDSRVLICWRFPSGDFGASRIVPQGVRVVAQGLRRLEYPRFGEVAEIMAILRPGEDLRAHRYGNGVNCTHAVLRWDGEKISVLAGGPEIFNAEIGQEELVAS